MPPAPEGANLPPQDLDAEEAVLGAMMINEQAVLTVSEVIKDPGDFYREAHGTVFRAILALLTRSEPIDAVTVSDELERMGKLEDVGGRGFIFGLSSSVTVAANAKSHAQIVRDVAVMRRVAAAGLEIAQLGYQRQGDVRQILDQAESAIFDVAQSRNTSELIPISELLPEEVERMEAAGEHRGLTGAPSGLNSLDKITSGFQASNLVILAARPAMGKTSLALGIARHLGVEAKIPVVIFSLEMSRNEIAQRFISSEARVDSTRMRRGDLRDEDWVRVQDACNRLTSAPIYVDDTAGINLMEIRSKARRLKMKEPNLGLILVDYLQLMSANDTAESRVQEISQISRSLKVLARELNIPVLALSQLSRAVESRTDKRPLLSDLRESGCLTGDTRVFLPDSGERIRMDQMSGRIGECVLAVNPETWELERRVVTNAFSTGVKPVYRLTLASGRTIRATGNHRFRLLGDWQRLDQLKIGDRLAVPVELPADTYGDMQPNEVALLGHLIGDGCTLPRHAIQYTTAERPLAELVAGLASSVFGTTITPRVSPERTWFQTYLPATQRLARGRRNPIAAWLDGLGAFGYRAWEKSVPARIFEQSDELIALFLRHLWSTDGSVWAAADGRSSRIYYATTSSDLAHDVQHLLLRLGITSALRVRDDARSTHCSYTVDIESHDSQYTFVTAVGCLGQRAVHLSSIRTMLEGRVANSNVDVIPASAWQTIVKPQLAVAGVTTRALQSGLGMQYSGSSLYRSGLGRERARRVADITGSDELRRLADGQVTWDAVTRIELDGEEEVFDLTVTGLHNFVAEDIIVHNSIEQDADVVMFIYRDDYYNKETSEKPGIAELIVAKHRNGAVGGVDLAFMPHFTTFSDLARGEA